MVWQHAEMYEKQRWGGKGFIKQMVCPATPLRPCLPAAHFSELLRERQLALAHWQSCFSCVVKLMLGCRVSFYRVTTYWLLVASHNSCLTGVPKMICEKPVFQLQPMHPFEEHELEIFYPESKQRSWAFLN